MLNLLKKAQKEVAGWLKSCPATLDNRQGNRLTQQPMALPCLHVPIISGIKERH